MTTKKCIEIMVDILKELEEAKNNAQKEIEATYAEYVADMDAANKVPQPKNVLKKVATAILKEKDMNLLMESKLIMQILNESER